MTAKTRPRPITVENSWLNKSLEERIGIMRTVSPAKAEAISVMVNHALRDEWRDMSSSRTGVPGAPYQWKCDDPRVTKPGGDR